MPVSSHWSSHFSLRDAYNHGLNGRQVAWAMRKYCGHCVLLANTMDKLEKPRIVMFCCGTCIYGTPYSHPVRRGYYMEHRKCRIFVTGKWFLARSDCVDTEKRNRKHVIKLRCYRSSQIVANTHIFHISCLLITFVFAFIPAIKPRTGAMSW